jgi:predicted  nucleic acid-binding Zn-ribbon protein
MQDEPTAKDLKAGSKSTADLAKKQNQLAVLLKHKDELLDQYKKGQITIEQYKDKIGNIPQHIKNLTAQIEKATIADDQLDEYEMGDESDKLSHHEKVGAIIDALEDHLEGGTEYTESQLHDVIEDYAYDNPMSDKAAEELFFDVEEKLYDLGYEKVS